MKFLKENVSLMGDYNGQQVYIFFTYSGDNSGLCRAQMEDGTIEVLELDDIYDIRDYVEPSIDEILNELMDGY